MRVLERAATYLGLVAPQPGRPRSRWQRVTAVHNDSTRSEAVLGLAYCALLAGLMALNVWSNDGLFWRVLGAVAALIFVGGVIRIALILPRLGR